MENNGVWMELPQCQAYLDYIKLFGPALENLMKDLQDAIQRAEAVWHDDSVERAKTEAAQCIANLKQAFEELQPVLQKLQAQVDWAVAGASM